MSGNTIGSVFRLTTFGESHSPAIGGIVEGCPAGIRIDPRMILADLARRNPALPGTTPRKEPDEPEFLEGVTNNHSLGTPIRFIIKNLDARPSDYEQISDVFRPSHADYTYFRKYGQIPEGGGRASGRETAARVVGGSIARALLLDYGIQVQGQIETVGGEKYLEAAYADLISKAETQGDTMGGTISCRIKGLSPGLGEPVFDKLQADLAKAVMSIGSAKGFEYGLGFKAADCWGSEYNDQMNVDHGKVVFLTNHDGGIQGGISNGEEINFRVAFKPVPSISIPQKSLDINGNPVTVRISGRHDVCHVPRLVVVVESMAALVVADHLLRSQSNTAG